MFHSGRLRYSDNQRAFWLLVALAVMLLVFVSISGAQAAGTPRLIDNLRRDLGALRVQLEQVELWDLSRGQQTVAFNADIGDGSPTFRRLSLVTVVRAANRHLESLVAAYDRAGDPRRSHHAGSLRLAMYELQERIDLLRTASSPSATVGLRDEALQLLADLELGLEGLASGDERAQSQADHVGASAATERR